MKKFYTVRFTPDKYLYGDNEKHGEPFDVPMTKNSARRLMLKFKLNRNLNTKCYMEDGYIKYIKLQAVKRLDILETKQGHEIGRGK